MMIKQRIQNRELQNFEKTNQYKFFDLVSKLEMKRENLFSKSFLLKDVILGNNCKIIFK